MRAFAAAYPGQITNVRYEDGDYAATVNGVTFYFAGGRLLPANLTPLSMDYSPHPFYTYTPGMPVWEEPTEEDAERIRAAVARRNGAPLKRSQEFYDTLLRAGTKDDAYARVKSMRFLGRSVLVHYSIIEELSLVEEAILGAAKKSPAVRTWIDNLDSVTGWNWRSIAGTESRSFHSYGTAIDLLPRNRGNRDTYWLWTSAYNADWWAVPYSRRLNPPEEVIAAFESYGFIWGGKWLFYDTMHFEYRPEIFALNGIDYKRAW
jgi:hypothetical protein